MSTTQPLREVREHGLEACEAEDGRMMCVFDSRLTDTVDAVLKVGRRMALADLSLSSVSKGSFKLSATAVGGGTGNGAGEGSLSGVRRWEGVLIKEDPDDGLR